MDIAEIKQDVISHEIKHPKTGEKIGVRVTLLPINSDELKKLQRSFQNRRNNQAAKGKTISAEEMEEFGIQVIVTAVTNWEWYGPDVTFHGERPEFNKANVKRVCKELDWFAKDIDEALGDTKAFFTD